MSGYDSPRTAIGVLEEDPTLGQQAVQGSSKLCIDETSPRRGHGSSMEHFFGPSGGLYCPKNYFEKSWGNNSATRTCSPMKILEMKVKFDISKSPIDYGVFW